MSRAAGRWSRASTNRRAESARSLSLNTPIRTHHQPRTYLRRAPSPPAGTALRQPPGDPRPRCRGQGETPAQRAAAYVPPTLAPIGFPERSYPQATFHWLRWLPFTLLLPSRENSFPPAERRTQLTRGSGKKHGPEKNGSGRVWRPELSRGVWC